jgi:type IX secretion system PorP/SprF family membrane protein
MKRYILSVILLGAAFAVKAQQLQTSSMYDLQGVIHNPSTAGVYMKGMVGATYRSQWSGLSGSPKTATVFGSFELPEQKIGLGGYIYNDKTGPTSRTGIALQFAKHIPMANGAKFSVGIEARGLQYAIDRAKLSATLGSDPALGTADNRFKFDAGFGVSYTGKKLQLGASVAQLVQSKLGFNSAVLGSGEEARLYRHYYFHGAYKWAVDPNTSITPSFMFIYLPNAPLEFQGGFRVEHNELFWWGLALRAKQSFILSAGVNLNKKFTIGYAYDIYKTPVSVFDNGSNAHEVLLRYNLFK